MLIERINITADPDEAGEWPFTVPAVRQVADAGLVLKSPLTFLVGENGSGKSTLVEAVAEAWGINPRGGRGKPDRRPEPGSLASKIAFDLTAQGQRFHSSRNRRQSCATHSPVIASTPGADILELSDSGIGRTGWEDLELVGHWRQYLNHPGSYLRHLLAE